MITWLPNLIVMLSVAFLAGCGGAISTGTVDAGSETEEQISLTVPALAYQDKLYSIDLNSLPASGTIGMINAPPWLSHDLVNKRLKGVPDGHGQVFSNIRFSVQTSAGTMRTLGPFSIAVVGDPLKIHQWHLKNIGQTNFAINPGIAGNDINLGQALADGLTGKGIKVAVSDSGVEIAHEDLAANILSGASKNYNLPAPYIGDPTPTADDEHGTAVAGLIGAVGWNSLGGRGVAPEAKIAGLLFIGSDQSTAKKIDQASGSFDVFNYSYGGNPTQPPFEDDPVADQLKYGVNNYRSGKGAVYIKSAGNEYVLSLPQEAPYLDLVSAIEDCVYPELVGGSDYVCRYYGNSNLGGPLNVIPQTLIVGALDSRGRSASYSSPGSNIWISAPGGEYGDDHPAIMTTDLQSCSRGSSSSLIIPRNSFQNSTTLNTGCKYTSTMNGTSSAAPITSGVVALLLEANPNLTWRDVKYILAATATKTDPNSTATSHPAGYNLPGHTYQEGWIQNGAGFWFHNWYGFGRINVDQAVQLARNYTSTLNPLRVTESLSGGWVYSSGVINQPIPDFSATGTTSTISVNHSLVVEAVQVRFSTTHLWPSDLGVELTSPDGTKSILLNINSGIMRNDNLTYDAILLSNAFFGENSLGTWTLKVIDGSTFGTSSLISWDIKIFGHNDPTSTDKTPPAATGLITHAAAHNSSSTSPSISWVPSASSDVIRYEYSISTTPGGTNTRAWTPVGLQTAITATGLTLTVGSTYYVNTRAIDSSENVSSVTSSSGWLYSTLAAPTVTLGTFGANVISSGTLSLTATYVGASAITLAPGDVVKVSSGGADCSIGVAGSGTTSRSISISGCSGNGTLRLGVGPNTASNSVGLVAGTSGISTIVTVDNLAPTVTGIANDAIPKKVKSFSWGCSEPSCQYRFLIDSNPSTSPMGAYASTGTASLGTGTGTFYIHVQARDPAGNQSPVVHGSFVLDNTAPTVIGLSDDLVWKKTKTWNWACSEPGCTFRHIVDNSSGTSPTGSFGIAQNATVSSGTGDFYVHVQASDTAGNLSPILHALAKIDNSGPSSPSTAIASGYSSSLVSSPTVTLTGGTTDVGSGFQKLQVRVLNHSTSAVLADWMDYSGPLGLTAGGFSSGQTYRAESSSLDNLSNRSTISQATWIVDNQAPAPLGSIGVGAIPYTLSFSPPVTFTNPSDPGGSGINFVEFRVVKLAGSVAASAWTPLTSGGSIGGLSLEDDTLYFFESRAWDRANNVSSVFSSSSFRTNHHLYSSIRSGRSYNCGITTLGSVKCWGSTPLGSQPVPKLVPGLESGVTDLSLGTDHACAIKSDGAFCWGSNVYGQLGIGSFGGTFGVSSVSSLSTQVSSISSGHGFSCAVRNGAAYCWGLGNEGRLGDGNAPTSASTPSLVFGFSFGAVKVTSGSVHSCVNTSTSSKCFGVNDFQIISDSVGSHASQPYELAPKGIGLVLALGSRRSCGVDGAIPTLKKCWGDGGVTGIGTDTGTPSSLPSGFDPTLKLVTGIEASCGINGSNQLRCMGRSPQIALGATVTTGTFAIVSGGSALDVSLSPYSLNGCAVLSSNLPVCWGVNESGQVGDKTTTTRTSPVTLLNH